MRVALFGKSISKEMYPYLSVILEKLRVMDASLLMYEPFDQTLPGEFRDNFVWKLFNDYKELHNNADFLLSIGGDGTLLDTITLVRDSGIPILGINLGRMGFLSSISKDKIEIALNSLHEKKFRLDQRTLIRFETKNQEFGELNYALNEITIFKRDLLTMISIEVFVNDEYLNTYWADGLLIATPTGSTAYSLSVGGPIILPSSQNLLITPIATHNLTVRPLVIPDDSTIKIKVISRTPGFYVSLDSRSHVFGSDEEFVVKKEKFMINLIQMEDDNFFRTLRKKLLWGLDLRNESNGS